MKLLLCFGNSKTFVRISGGAVPVSTSLKSVNPKIGRREIDTRSDGSGKITATIPSTESAAQTAKIYNKSFFI